MTNSSDLGTNSSTFSSYEAEAPPKKQKKVKKTAKKLPEPEVGSSDMSDNASQWLQQKAQAGSVSQRGQQISLKVYDKIRQAAQSIMNSNSSFESAEEKQPEQPEKVHHRKHKYVSHSHSKRVEKSQQL